MKTYLKITQFLVIIAALIVIAVVGFGAFVGIGSLTASAVAIVFGFVSCFYIVPAVIYQNKEVAKVKPLVNVHLQDSYTKLMAEKQA